MAITLSNGYIKPEDGDTGAVWFDALEDNIQRVNDHNHDGSNSEIVQQGSRQFNIPRANLQKFTARPHMFKNFVAAKQISGRIITRHRIAYWQKLSVI